MRKMKIALLLVALFAFSSELFAYNFKDLNIPYSEDVFEKKYWAFFRYLEEELTKKMWDKNDASDIIEDIAAGVVTWDEQLLKDYLLDEKFWDDEIATITSKMPRLELAISADYIKSLWKIDVEKLIQDYLSTWKLDSKYKKYESSLRQISDLMVEIKDMDSNIKDMDSNIKGYKNEIKIGKDKIKRYKEIQEMIQWIKDAMSWVKK